MSDDTPLLPGLSPVEGLDIHARFDGGALSSDGGVLLLRDVAGTGDLGTLNAGIQYSYDFQISEEFHLRPGIHFNYRKQSRCLLWYSIAAWSYSL